MILALFRERVDDEHALGAVIDKGYSGDSAATAEEKAATVVAVVRLVIARAARARHPVPPALADAA